MPLNPDQQTAINGVCEMLQRSGYVFFGFCMNPVEGQEEFFTLNNAQLSRAKLASLTEDALDILHNHDAKSLMEPPDESLIAKGEA
jgi:hypothetical protein